MIEIILNDSNVKGLMKKMDFDVIIVGGGPAGLSAANRAAQLGCKVAVFEKSKEIGYPIHTSGGSWIDELQKIGVPAKFMHPIKYGEFVGDKSKAVFKYETSPSCILDVRGYYQYLAEQASLAGAEIFVNAKVFDHIFSDNFVKGVRVNINGEQYDAYSKIVIDASGFNAIIARKVGLLDKFKVFGVGAEYDLVAPSWDQDKVALIFSNKVAPAGYGWVFPCGNSRVRVGIAIIRPISRASPVKSLDAFLSSDHEIVNALKPYSKIEFHQGVIPSDGILPKTVYNGLIVVGDAAGQILAIAGEGIRFAVDIGGIAGSVAAKALSNVDYSEGFLKDYEKTWREKYELKFKIAYEINKRLRGYTEEGWDEKIEILSRLSPDLVVALLKGHFSTQVLFKALKQQPGFISKAICKVIRQMLEANVKKRS